MSIYAEIDMRGSAQLSYLYAVYVTNKVPQRLTMSKSVFCCSVFSRAAAHD